MNDNNYYMLADGQAAENLVRFANLCLILADREHLESIKQDVTHWLKIFRDSAHAFRGSQNIPANAKKAWK